MQIPEWLETLIERCRDSHELWTILTALRGYDYPRNDFNGRANFTLFKRLTTARLRYIVGATQYASGVNNPNPLSDSEIDTRNLLLQNYSYHFSCHFKSAIILLRELGYAVPHAERIFAVVP